MHWTARGSGIFTRIGKADVRRMMFCIAPSGRYRFGAWSQGSKSNFAIAFSARRQAKPISMKVSLFVNALIGRKS
jgi:hypothetical protein